MQQLPFFVRSIEYSIKQAFIKYHDADNLLERITEEYRNKYITDNDEKLLGLFFKTDVSQEDLDKFLSEWDIEEEGAHKALMLAYFMKKHPELKYPQYVEPRLNGLLKYFKYRNLRQMSYFKKICRAIKQKNVDIMIIKGGSLRFYNPDYPRIMGDIDILVGDENYKTAVDTALSFGYKYFAFEHSVDIYDPNLGFLVDIHRKLNMQTISDIKFNEDVFKRAHKEKVFDVDDIYVPCPEDVMFILLINLNKDLAQHTATNNFLYYIADSMFLLNLKPDFNWDIVKETVIKTNSKLHIALAIHFLNRFVPVKLPELFADEFREICMSFLYDELNGI